MAFEARKSPTDFYVLSVGLDGRLVSYLFLLS